MVVARGWELVVLGPEPESVQKRAAHGKEREKTEYSREPCRVCGVCGEVSLWRGQLELGESREKCSMHAERKEGKKISWL